MKYTSVLGLIALPAAVATVCGQESVDWRNLQQAEVTPLPKEEALPLPYLMPQLHPDADKKHLPYVDGPGMCLVVAYTPDRSETGGIVSPVLEQYRLSPDGLSLLATTRRFAPLGPRLVQTSCSAVRYTTRQPGVFRIGDYAVCFSVQDGSLRFCERFRFAGEDVLLDRVILPSGRVMPGLLRP